MKHSSRLIFLTSLVAASGILGCDNDSDAGSSELPTSCQITQADCSKIGKSLDVQNCICIDSGSPQKTCPLTEAMCASANKMLDAQNCACIDTPAQCLITQADCNKIGKSFDAQNCICIDSGSPQQTCPLTEAMCASANKMLDAQNCTCIDTPAQCQITQADCSKIGKSFDAQNCICIDSSTTCSNGQHIFGNGCEDDSTDNCGQHGNRCNSSVSGWKNGSCTNGACIVSECEAGYQVDGNSCICAVQFHKVETNNSFTCEADSVAHCGEHDYQCANEIDGWKQGECSNGKCSATECIENYHVHNHICEMDSKEHCGGHNLDCRNTMSGFLDGQCFNHTCIATACLQEYHLYQNTCEPDDENHCGKHSTSCFDVIPGFATGACVEKECHVQTCADGYHLDSANNSCIVDTNDCCGESCEQCTYPRICSKGACEAKCDAPLSKCNNECHNYTNEMKHCGGCNKSCTTNTISNSSKVVCSNALCKATSCISGYHVYDGQCEKDTLNHCGDHDVQCNVDNATNICSNGLCSFICDPEYHKYYEVCEHDSTMNCGEHGIQCNVANAYNNCEDKVCSFSCKPGYHIYNNGCEQDTIENCGNHGIQCNVADAYNNCKDKLCSFSCKPGYHIYNNGCEKDTFMNCGTHNRQCAIGDIIIFGNYHQFSNSDTTPIEWRVLDLNSNGHVLIISEKVLEVMAYRESGSGPWQSSKIRSWLNDSFLNTAFTDDERTQIISSNVPAHTNPDYASKIQGNATTDKIFLLSFKEAKEYFKDNASRRADATRYAVSRGAHVYGSDTKLLSKDGTCKDTHCYALWWLRTVGGGNACACQVIGVTGSVDSYGGNMHDTYRSVRPALWLDMNQ